ncbi:arginine-ornithine antiporter [Clostridium estertheticum]|uniref:arginine-ornithine antiporter n=1 Tax=Clostridium estertheticum TaxID=238834 RepID=UPI001CF3A9AB|nr:arginine-ornithine antiporter [Clostridium estertheticum]MCB2307925.1 arginine-ornithine antiporter [Clostridium estertheticum]MCB2346049.1 arginine-ornithine antiporter [Clostridium estertheticum]MCB2351307.1 arginine-ornithine antiporter [Clostridium estertheticum]WAG44194.1 arginine-ornithine antiporter [Clostridium estertheticum]
MADKSKKLGVFSLTALVITSSIGAGIFNISGDLASGAAAGPAIIAWIIVGFGILMLSLSFNNLLLKKPELNGIFSYAKEGFGEFGGFISGWGYWLSAWLGNVAFATMLMSTLSYFFPIFGNGQNVASIIGASIIMWVLTYIVNRGVEEAAIINTVVTIFKLIPIFLFIVIGIVAFKVDLFTNHFWGNISTNFNLSDIYPQVKSCMMVMMWVFVGIEGASMLSSRANKKSEAGRATILGLIGLLLVYVLASMIPYGVMSKDQLSKLATPSMAYILKDIVGPWGAAFINIGLIISVSGAWLSWTMLPSETTLLMARSKLLPKVFGKVNKAGAPTFSLIITAVLTQLFIFTFLFTDKAYQFAYSLCTAAILVCYLFVGLYQFKISYLNRHEKGQIKQIIVGLITVIFETWAIVVSGLNYTLLCLIAYIPGIVFFAMARKENGEKKLLTKTELILTALIILGAIYIISQLATGKVAI